MSTPSFIISIQWGGGGNGEIGRLDFPANETTTKCKGKLKKQKTRIHQCVSWTDAREWLIWWNRWRFISNSGGYAPGGKNKSNQREKIHLPISRYRSHGVCLYANMQKNTWPNAERKYFHRNKSNDEDEITDVQKTKWDFFSLSRIK